MKIAIINNYINPYIIGGAEIVIEDFIYELAKRGLKVVLITSGKNKNIEISSPHINMKIYRFYPLNLYFNYPLKVKRNKLIKALWWVTNLWNPFVFFTIRRVLKENTPDIVNIHNFYGLSPAVFTAAKSLKIPVIFTAHDFFPLCIYASFMKSGTICRERCLFCFIWGWWNKVFMKSLNFCFLSQFSANIYKKYLNTSNFIICHNPVFLTKEAININISARTERQRALSRIRFIYLGVLSKHKGISTLLDAFSKAPLNNIELVIAGNGDLKDKIENFAKKDPRIKYLGFVQGEAKRKALLDSDVLILPSEWYEVSPLTIQEAYAFGLPIIGTDIGSIPEHIKLNETGWLFPYKDVHRLSEIIEYLGKNIQVIIKYSKKCFREASLNSTNSYIEKMVTFYENCSK